MEAAAERGAARALKAERETLKAAYIPKQTALDLLCISDRSLRRLVSEGYIRANSMPGRKAVYYCREDIEAYLSGKRLIPRI